MSSLCRNCLSLRESAVSAREYSRKSTLSIVLRNPNKSLADLADYADKPQHNFTSYNICEIMQPAAVICVICERITRKRTQSMYKEPQYISRIFFPYSKFVSELENRLLSILRMI